MSQSNLNNNVNNLAEENIFEIRFPKYVTSVTVHQVVPEEINKSLFEGKRENSKEEILRSNIRYALKHLPGKFSKPFKIIEYAKSFKGKSFVECQKFVNEYGDHWTQEVEFFLSIAYKISKGESWETFCKNDNEGIYTVVQGDTRYYYLFNGTEMKSTISTVGWSSDDYEIMGIEKDCRIMITKY